MATHDSDYDFDLPPRFCSVLADEGEKGFKVWVYGKTFGEFVITCRDWSTKVSCAVCRKSIKVDGPDGLDPTDLRHDPDCLWVERLKQLNSKN